MEPGEELDYDKRIIVKKVQNGKGIGADWYHFSLVTSYSRGTIELNDNTNFEKICESSYLSDIEFIGNGDTLKLVFWKNKFDLIKESNKFGIHLVIDTNGVQPNF